jgi:hypothetical protein
MHYLPAWFTHISSGSDITQSLLWSSHLDWAVLATQFNTDVFAGVRQAFSNFIQSGQAWALAIGFVLGYLLRGFTTYG